MAERKSIQKKLSVKLKNILKTWQAYFMNHFNFSLPQRTRTDSFHNLNKVTNTLLQVRGFTNVPHNPSRTTLSSQSIIHERGKSDVKRPG